MFGFLLNLLTVGLQSYTIYFLNSKFPETGQKIEQDIKGAAGSSLELNDGSPASGTENLRMEVSQQAPDNEVQVSQSSANESQSSRISPQNSPKDSPALSNPQVGEPSAPMNPSGNATEASANS